MTSPAIQAADKAQKAPRAVSEVSFFRVSFFLTTTSFVRELCAASEIRIERAEQRELHAITE